MVQPVKVRRECGLQQHACQPCTQADPWPADCRSFMFGLAGAYDPLGSQAYGGGNQVRPLLLPLSSPASVQEALVLKTLSLRLPSLAV